MLRRAIFLLESRGGLGFVVTVGLLGFLLAGCGDGAANRTTALHETSNGAFPTEAFRQAAGTRAQALQALHSLDRSALQKAFGALERLAYTRRVRTEALDADGQVTTFAERVVRHGPGGPLRVVESDSSGAFDFGALGRFVDAETGAPATNLMRQLLPEEPAFLSERNRYAFQYRLLPDTALAGSGPARVVAVRARPGADGEQQTTRQARLYLDAATGLLVALRLHRVQHSLLFDEDTHQYVRLQPGPSRSQTDWVPAETRFETHLDMPLRPARRFRSSASYSQYSTSPS